MNYTSHNANSNMIDYYYKIELNTFPRNKSRHIIVEVQRILYIGDKYIMKITVAGTGYVGLSIATLLSQHHPVKAVDIIEEKVNMINNRKSPIQDNEIEDFLSTKKIRSDCYYRCQICLS